MLHKTGARRFCHTVAESSSRTTQEEPSAKRSQLTCGLMSSLSSREIWSIVQRDRSSYDKRFPISKPQEEVRELRKCANRHHLTENRNSTCSWAKYTRKRLWPAQMLDILRRFRAIPRTQAVWLEVTRRAFRAKRTPRSIHRKTQTLTRQPKKLEIIPRKTRNNERPPLPFEGVKWTLSPLSTPLTTIGVVESTVAGRGGKWQRST